MYSDITNTCSTPCVSVYSVLVPLDGLLFTGITTLLPWFVTTRETPVIGSSVLPPCVDFQ